jgi:PST family polysaccharide transporter
MSLTSRGLARRSIGASFWVGASTFSTRIVEFGSKALLARMLDPDHFGLVTMAGVAIAGLGLIQGLGLGTAIVQRRDRVVDAASTAFWALPLLGCLLAAIGYLTAPLAAYLLNEPRILEIVRVLACTMIPASLTWVPSALLARDLEFRKVFWADMLSSVAFGAVSIILALRGLGAMSLAYGYLASSITRAVGMLVLSSFRPRLYFSASLFGELFRYGRSAMSVSIVSNLLPAIESGIIGRFLGSSLLGLYGLALQLVQLVGSQLTTLVLRVAFPAFAEIQHDEQRIRAAYERLIHLVALTVAPAACGAGVAAPWLVPLVFGAGWSGAVPLVACLAPVAVSGALRVVMRTLLMGIGKAGEAERLAWVDSVLLVAAVSLSALTGSILAVALAASLASIASLAAYVSTFKKVLAWEPALIIGPVWRPSLAAMAMVAAEIPVYFLDLQPLPGALIAVGLGVLAYTAAAWVFDQRAVRALAALVMPKGAA